MPISVLALDKGRLALAAKCFKQAIALHPEDRNLTDAILLSSPFPINLRSAMTRGGDRMVLASIMGNFRLHGLGRVSQRACLLIALLLYVPSGAAVAATPAESFISGNVQIGLHILNDKQLTVVQRKAQFEEFLLGITDMKRIAAFTLGRYGTAASQTDKDAFARAFQDYAVAVYQSYFAKYSGQTLMVVRSTERAPGDSIVETNLVDPGDHSGQAPLEIDFRVRTDSSKPVIVDFAVAGIWLALAERDDFGSVLAQGNGRLPALIKHLREVTGKY